MCGSNSPKYERKRTIINGDIAFLVYDFLIGVTGNWEGTESKVGVSAVMCTTGEVLYLIG